MSCNCKKITTLEDDYGIREEESLVGKSIRMLKKVLMFFLLLMIGIVLTPIVIGVIIYKASFTKDMVITLPKFMGKYMK